jgi:hypothetical protein
MEWELVGETTGQCHFDRQKSYVTWCSRRSLTLLWILVKYRFYWMKQKLWKFSRFPHYNFRLLWSQIWAPDVATSSTNQMEPSQRQ